METNGYEAVSTGDWETSPPFATTSHRAIVHDIATICCSNPNNQNPNFCLPLQEIDVVINSSIKACSVLNTGLQIVVIWHNIVQTLGAPINHQHLIEMEGANSATNWTIGCTENLILQVGDMLIKTHAHVVKHASFNILLG